MEKFFEAISSGNAEKVKLMLTLGQDPNVKNSDGFSPLNVAISHTEAISQTRSAHVSVAPFARKIIEMLISAGADVNSVEADSCGLFYKPIPLLHSAIFQGLPEVATADIVNMLISAGANVNAVDKDGNSVLHRAVLCGNRGSHCYAELINLLISAGADVTATNKEGKTALELMR